MKKLQPALAGTAFGLAVLAGAPAAAQTYSIAIANGARNIGTIVTGETAETVFSIDTAGGITKSGPGTKIPTLSSTSVVTVSIACGNQNACNTSSNDLFVTITAGTATGRAKTFRNFDVAPGSTNPADITSESGTGTNPRTFWVGHIGKNSNKQFVIAMDFPVKGDNEATVGSGYGSNSSVANFTVEADPVSGTTVSTTGSITATTYKALLLTKNSDLSFGRIVRPSSGTSTVTINATTGLRTFSGATLNLLGTPTPSRASYTVSGQASTAITVTVPTSATISSGANDLTVALTKTGSTSTTLNSSGAYAFGVGASVDLSNTTPSGAYTGTFPVTVNYN